MTDHWLMFFNPSTFFFFTFFSQRRFLASDLITRIHSTLLYLLTLSLSLSLFLQFYILCIISFRQSPTQRLP
ncbi:hypothetical protein ACQKWADRAFT_7435 [Trichoderma austrokoningii]